MITPAAAPGIGGNGRAEGDLVIVVTHLHQHGDGTVAPLAGETIVAGDDEHLPALPALDQPMRKHHHKPAGGAARLQRVGVARLEPEIFGKRASPA